MLAETKNASSSICTRTAVLSAPCLPVGSHGSCALSKPTPAGACTTKARDSQPGQNAAHRLRYCRDPRSDVADQLANDRCTSIDGGQRPVCPAQVHLMVDVLAPGDA